MDDRVALLTGAVAGVLHQLMVSGDFTYEAVTPEVVDDNYTNRVFVTAADGVRFVVTVERMDP